MFFWRGWINYISAQRIVNIKIILSYINANEMHENFSFDMILNLFM